MEQMGQPQQQQAKILGSRPVQVWRGILSWIAFMSQLLVQIIRATPSIVQFLLSYIGFAYSPLISSSSSSSSSSSTSVSSQSFKPLPVVEIPPHDAPITDKGARFSTPADDGDCLERLTVVLDLDETLVCAYETSSLPGVIRTQAVEGGLEWFELECVSSNCDGESKINYVTVFERPGLREFLKEISAFSDLVLFTAGLEGYARPLVDRIDVENLFRDRLYRPSTVSSGFREHVKDLSCVSKDLCRIVLVDNNPFSFVLQPLNGIPCIPFSASQPHDDHLMTVLLPLLKHLSLQKDVRPVLYERFHMPEWFQMHGVPASSLPT